MNYNGGGGGGGGLQGRIFMKINKINTYCYTSIILLCILKEIFRKPMR